MKKILLDIDGVLANFVKGACDFLGVNDPYREGRDDVLGKWDLLEHIGMTPAEKNQFWQDINREDFWANLELLPEAIHIVKLCEEYVGTHNVCLLSSPGHMEYAMPGKLKWINRHFPQFGKRFLFGSEKQFCANPHHILVDDYEKNVSAFRNHRGDAFLVPRPWNHLYKNEDQLIQSLNGFLETL